MKVAGMACDGCTRNVTNALREISGVSDGTVFFSARLSVVTLAPAGAFSIYAFAAEQLEFRRTAGEFIVYLAVMPAELVTGPRPAPEPSATPFQPPAAADTHHVMVSIFENRTGRRVTEGVVAARVAALGFSGVRKVLKPTTIAGGAVFANSFPMIGRGPFRIDVEFHAPGAQRDEHPTFYFTHPSFAPPQRETRKERGP